MAIIVGGTSVGGSGIGYKNLFNEAGAVITVSSEDTVNGFYKENAYNWLGYDEWKPTVNGDSWIRVTLGGSRIANYMAIWGHDLADHGASVKPQYSTDGVIWNDAAAVVAPSNNNTLYFGWDDTNASHYRVLVNAPTTIPVISGVQIGESLTLPHAMEVGFAPPSLVPINEIKTARSEGGVFIGGSTISKGIEGSINLTQMDPAWVRSEWIPFIQHVQTPRPFVFAWDGTNYPTEVVLAWIKARGRIKAPNYNDSLYMTISLAFEGTP
jgi:hypothetical protein